jgi:hypothetical protein
MDTPQEGYNLKSKYVVMNHIETIVINGHPLRIVRYSEPLFRSDKEKRNANRANVFYRNRNGRSYDKYFTKTEKEAKGYARPHIHQWIPSEPLRLVDILDIKTRESLHHLINPRDVNISFPVSINENKPRRVYRFSEEDYIEHDNAVLAQLCALGHGIDGYYMEKQLSAEGTKHPTLNGYTIKQEFHSEIGVCKESLHKLRLVGAVKRLIAPPPPKRGKKDNTRNSRVPYRMVKEESKEVAIEPMPLSISNLALPSPGNKRNQWNQWNQTNQQNKINMNLSAMLEENRTMFGLAPSTPTKKRHGNNNAPQTPPRKTVKRRNNNTPGTPPRKIMGKSLFSTKKK